MLLYQKLNEIFKEYCPHHEEDYLETKIGKLCVKCNDECVQYSACPFANIKDKVAVVTTAKLVDIKI